MIKNLIVGLLIAGVAMLPVAYGNDPQDAKKAQQAKKAADAKKLREAKKQQEKLAKKAQKEAEAAKRSELKQKIKRLDDDIGNTSGKIKDNKAELAKLTKLLGAGQAVEARRTQAANSAALKNSHAELVVSVARGNLQQSSKQSQQQQRQKRVVKLEGKQAEAQTNFEFKQAAANKTTKAVDGVRKLANATAAEVARLDGVKQQLEKQRTQAKQELKALQRDGLPPVAANANSIYSGFPNPSNPAASGYSVMPAAPAVLSGGVYGSGPPEVAQDPN